MSTPLEIPDWLLNREPEPDPPLPPVDDHRVEGLVNDFIAGKQDALFLAPDAYYRRQGRDALDGAGGIADRLQALQTATLDQARNAGERAALAPRLDAHMDDALDGIGRHVAAQRTVWQRNTLGQRKALIQNAAVLEHDNDDKIAGLAEAHAGVAQELARLDGVEPGSDDDTDIATAARSQILRSAIEQRIANAKGPQAITLFDQIQAALSPADRRTLEPQIAATRDDAATDAWLAREAGAAGAPLLDRAGLDDGLSDAQRLLLQVKIAARDSANEANRAATVKGLDDQLAAAAKAIATEPATYRIGTLNAIANAYKNAGAPEQANDTGRLAQLESVLRLFAQTSLATQQQRLDDFSGPEHAMAETILQHQADAFARDPYAAGTALYPDIGSAVPEEDADGRLRQTRMIEARRGTPSTTVPPSGAELSDRDRMWTDGQPQQAGDPYLVLAANEPARAPSPDNGEPQADVDVAQAQPRPKPSARPSTQPGAKPVTPAPPVRAKPLPRQEQAATNRKEIDRLAGKPASDYPTEESFPADWERRLPQATLDALSREATAFKVPRELLARIMWKESAFVERAGEGTKKTGQGIAGISNVFAAKQLWDNWLAAAKRDPNDGAAWGELEMAARRSLGNMRLEAVPAIRMEAEYLRYLYDKMGHSWPAAVAAYKHGETVIGDFLNGQTTTSGIGDWGQVQAYLGKVFDGNAKRFDGFK